MANSRETPIRIRGARAHNLSGFDVEIPRGTLTVVTGVSGSGKSSLVFEILHAEGRRRYLETLSPRARRMMQQLPQADVEAVEHVSPSLALAQGTTVRDPRATAGTMSGLWDLLRLLYARHGTRGAAAAGDRLGPGLFSFNTPRGACPACHGLGLREEVAEDLLIADPSKTLRQGALVPTLKSGYIVYSQVTVDVLNEVCQAHGFDVDTPWQELSEEQQRVVLHGSERIEVPFGKHSLESRMRWEGITAKPRELGYYKGLVPTIAATLQRNRNPNVLRFARAETCGECSGTRLNEAARSVRVQGAGIHELAAWELPQLRDFWCRLEFGRADRELDAQFRRRLDLLIELGLGHLHCGRAASSLSGGEAQRIRLSTCATAGLSGLTFVFDEPSIGLHPSEEANVLRVLRRLRDAGNTVVVVEHSEHALRAADHLIDLGPGAGREGGDLLWAGRPAELGCAPASSATRRCYAQSLGEDPRQPRSGDAALVIRAATAHNLQGDDVELRCPAFNVICGVAGAGKSSLVDHTLAAALRALLHGATERPGAHAGIEGAERFKKIVHVDQSPIGRTPRSNAATYTGLFDLVRARFAAEPLAIERGYRAGTFSTNTKDGGRCPSCEGAGRETVGMHGLPDIELICASCAGRRYRDEILDVRHQGLSIAELLEAPIEFARDCFAQDAEPRRILDALHELGLGYLPLGQPATTLSGGEAQRVKLASELARPTQGETLYILDEPTTGLHRADVAQLLHALHALVEQGHSVVVVEHDLDVLRAADWLVELGPGSGSAGGQVVATGTPLELYRSDTLTGRALRGELDPAADESVVNALPALAPDSVQLRGVRTHNLRGFDVDIPARGLTVVTGVSGSGKSSLAFDTLHAQATTRFTEHLSAHARRQLGGPRAGELREARGLRPTVPLDQRRAAPGRSRSTVATLADLHALLRTLWSRCGRHADGELAGLPAGAFSFQRRTGACPTCEGHGTVPRCDPERLIADATCPLFGGALAQHAALKGLADPAGRHRALFDAVAARRGFDPALAWSELPDWAHQLALHGAGDEDFDAVWTAAKHEGEDGYRWRATWPGLCAEIETEYRKRRGSKRGDKLLDLLVDAPCPECDGERLASEARAPLCGGMTLGSALRQAVTELRTSLRELSLNDRDRSVAAALLAELDRRLARMQQLGLGHLQLDRAAATLSAGELQRTRLARQLAAPLHGVLYVLDEPTVGLHPRDVEALIQLLRELVHAGNGVVVVEHDRQLLSAADHVIELGPSGGRHGGALIAAAAPVDLPEDSRSAQLLAAPLEIASRAPRRGDSAPRLQIRGARANNLRDLDLDLLCGGLVAITGVSGSGKSSLLHDVIGASARRGQAVQCREIRGLERFDRVILPSRMSIGRSPQSCPATVLGIFDELRKRLATTEAARAAGLKAGAFAYASKGGRCESCAGLGRVRAADFDFLGDAWQRCPDCHGRRYLNQVLEVDWQGHNVADWLEASLDTVLERFEALTGARAERALAKPLDALRIAQSLALGYLPLGQGADTLSGGEAQRLFLAAELARGLSSSKRGDSRAPLLFLLDEPSRGLHHDDVRELLRSLDRLSAGSGEEPGLGHSFVLVEHDPQLIAAADQVIELGPGGGPDGGQLLRS
jgi:excinuclease ABC subunit A